MNTTQNDKDSFHTQEHQAPPFSPERTDHANSSKYKKSDMTAHGGLGKSLIVANQSNSAAGLQMRTQES